MTEPHDTAYSGGEESYRGENQTRRLVAIVTPQQRFPLTADEELSIRHLRHHLGHFDRYMIGTESLPVQYSDFLHLPFPARHFRSIHEYSRLLVSEDFYRAFADYEYILIYQLDCLVFSSNLEEWCRAGWDYIGSPWFKDYGQDPAGGFWAVGNGGLSLRKVSSALAVLTSTKRILDDPEIRGPQTIRFNSRPRLRRLLVASRTLLFQLGYHNNMRWLMREFNKHPPFHEDLFWSFHARMRVPDFKIPSPQQAVAFSFEMAPSYCFRQNSNRLPFGCHAWAKYDREFWKPYFLK